MARRDAGPDAGADPGSCPRDVHHGIVCTGETYAKVVKLTFAPGGQDPDSAGLFIASLEGNTRRAIDIHEGGTVDADAFKALVQAAVAQNGLAAKQPKAKAKPIAGKESGKVVLLSGGNPQIAKADGDAPVQAYIAAMPGWKRAFGERLDAFIVRTVSNLRRAVKWNSPFDRRLGSDRGLSVDWRDAENPKPASDHR